jgi:hypothetical protein
VSYEPWLSPRVMRSMKGLPGDALDVLVAVMARVCDDPRDPVYSSATSAVPGRRVADLDERGFVEFTVDEQAGLVRIYGLAWIG